MTLYEEFDVAKHGEDAETVTIHAVTVDPCQHGYYNAHGPGITWTVGHNPYGAIPGTLLMIERCEGPEALREVT